MARVTAEEVAAICETSLSEEQVEAFIATATVIVDAYLEDEGLSDDLLEQIELWLAAHLLSARDPRVSEVAEQELRVRYASGRLGLGLDGTFYGQQVMLLDYTGRLRDLGQGRVRQASLRAL